MESDLRLPKDAMKTLSLTQARKNLTKIVQRACKGEHIGLITNFGIVELRHCNVISQDDELKDYISELGKKEIKKLDRKTVRPKKDSGQCIDPDEDPGSDPDQSRNPQGKPSRRGPSAGKRRPR